MKEFLKHRIFIPIFLLLIFLLCYNDLLSRALLLTGVLKNKGSLNFLQFFFEYSKGMAEETKPGVCRVLDDVGGKVLDWNGCMEITHMVHDWCLAGD